MIQSTLDGGIGSSSKASKRKTKTKSIHFTIRGGRKSSRLTQSNGKKKKKIQEEQLDLEGEFEEDEMEKEMENEKEGAMLRIEIAGRERRVSTSQLPSVAHVLMKIGVPRACTAKACASRGSGLSSSSRNRIPRGPVPRRPALTVYRGGVGQGGSVQPNCHL
ncbi:unnamed protein product, partial [Brassica oleracea]